MRFVHTSDWHLGFRQYNIETRLQDFVRAASRTVNRILEINPDFVLHTGDLFHDNRPTAGVIRAAVRLLRRLNDKGIPVYMIRGNHDTHQNAKGGSIMHLLEDLDLIHFVNDEMISIGEIDIIGINYHPVRALEKKLSELVDKNIDRIKNDGKFSILALHNFIQGQLEGHEIPLTRLADLGFDYIGGGHYHIPWKKDRFNIYTPGSLEATSSNDWNREDVVDGIGIYSSFYLVESEKDGSGWKKPVVTECKVPVRPRITAHIESSAENLEQFEKEITEYLRAKLSQVDEMTTAIQEYKTEELKKPMLNMSVSTNLDQAEVVNLDRRKILDDFINPARLEISSLKVVELPDVTNSSGIIAATMKELIEEVESEMRESVSEFTGFVDQIISEFQDIPKSRFSKMQAETVEEYVTKALEMTLEAEK